MVKRAAAVGFSCVDVYEKLDLWYPTGNGIDWGIHLSRLGVSVSVVSAVGNDEYGREMKERLQAESIDISHLRTEEGATCRMLMDLRKGTDRVHLEEISGVMGNYRITKEEIAYVSGFDYLHTDLFGGVLKYLSEWKSKGVKVIMDFSVFSEDPEYECEKIFPFVDAVFFSYEGEKDSHLKDWMKKIHSYGPFAVTATLGEKGSISYDGDKFYEYGIFPVETVNTVGAGDSYIAGFSYGLMNGWEIPRCMEEGAKLSSQVVGRFEPY